MRLSRIGIRLTALSILRQSNTGATRVGYRAHWKLQHALKPRGGRCETIRASQWTQVTPHTTTKTTAAFDLYSLSSAAYLATQALPLLLTPKIIINLLTTADIHRTTVAEIYLARSHALLLLAFAALTLVLSGVIPLASTSSVRFTDDAPSAATTAVARKKNPYALPTAIVTTTYHALAAFYTYTNLTSSGWSFAFAAGLTCSAGLFFFGMWIILFGNSPARVSKSTGADKRTAGWPFGNSESAATIKKEAKREKERERGDKGKEREKEREKDKGRESDKEKDAKKRRSITRSGSSRA
ncbi:hypothetical protein LTR53_015120 [Teratosphaeriaceae sp. CCFEE 6253]|nr:hypothetical protein LTR53_015120 [Teratosphaeriaceae sp. CCFEE 6253]